MQLCVMILKKEISNFTSVLDSKFFKVLSEPVRIEILKELLIVGKCDVNTLAKKMPQDRSVISRHLSLMSEVGILTQEKEGRHVIYTINGKEIVERFEKILSSMKRCLTLDCC